MTVELLETKDARYYSIVEEGETLAYFESLKTAGTVLRYLKGTPMQKEDAQTAREALEEWDIACGSWKKGR